MQTPIFDKNWKELFKGDKVIYSDIEHGIVDGIGYIRFNFLSDIYEVINDDNQSGNSFSNLTNIIWQ